MKPKLIISISILAVAQLISAESVFAWGAGVHMMTALSMLDDISLILPSIGRAITSFPVEYLYGCLIADFFIGKGKGKAGAHPHNWEGGFKFLDEARNEQEVAYAYGFLSHLAADVVAHNLFVPSLINSYPATRRRGHFYWEIKADYSVVPGYLKIAKDVLGMDHRSCDKLLKQISGKRKNELKAKKLLYTQSVKLSDYCHVPHDFIFPRKMFRRQVFNDYTSFMINRSCRLVKDLLSHPGSSPCLSYDPMGKLNLRRAKRKGKGHFPRSFKPRRSHQPFTLDQELLNL
ncbi:MAG: zinc dependent phospholipase C family protein [Desulfobacterales bacterium]|nr:zinc dependent phospholipase C family protein [Desulfobacterales bacterium]